MQIQCSNCGAIQRFKHTAANVNSLLALGWSSYGGMLYCPACVVNQKGEPDGIAATARAIDLKCEEDNSDDRII